MSTGHPVLPRPPRRSRASVGLAVAGALLLAGCGEDDSVAEIVARDLRSGDAFADIGLSGGQAACAAEAVVASLGEERTLEAGLGDDAVEGADFTVVPDPVLEVVAGAIDRCVPDLDRVLADALVDGIVDEPEDDLPLTTAEARCVADDLVDGFGAERLLVLGARTGEGDPFDAGPFDEDETAVVADSFLDCLDVREIFRSQFVTDGVPEETAACLAREIPDTSLRELFAAQFAGEATDLEPLIGPAMTTCGLR